MRECFKCNRRFKPRRYWHEFCDACWKLPCKSCGRNLISAGSSERLCKRCRKPKKARPPGLGRPGLGVLVPNQPPSERAERIEREIRETHAARRRRT